VAACCRTRKDLRHETGTWTEVWNLCPAIWKLQSSRRVALGAENGHRSYLCGHTHFDRHSLTVCMGDVVIPCNDADLDSESCRTASIKSNFSVPVLSGVDAVGDAGCLPVRQHRPSRAVDEKGVLLVRAQFEASVRHDDAARQLPKGFL
jgi:hypothetical protein